MSLEAVAVFNYITNQEDELNLKVGDIITNVHTFDGGWCEGELNGKKGMFPENFVKMMQKRVPVKDEEKRESQQSRSVQELTSKFKDNVSSGELPKKREKQKRCKVLYEYTRENADELDLRVGDLINFHNQVEDGWWEGSLNGKHGVFPSNFVEMVEETASEDESVDENFGVSEEKSTAQEYAVAQFSYTAEQPDELSLVQGRIVRIIEKELVDEGWWKGEVDGKVGIFPVNFVELLPNVESSKANKAPPLSAATRQPSLPKLLQKVPSVDTNDEKVKTESALYGNQDLSSNECSSFFDSSDNRKQPLAWFSLDAEEPKASSTGKKQVAPHTLCKKPLNEKSAKSELEPSSLQRAGWEKNNGPETENHNINGLLKCDDIEPASQKLTHLMFGRDQGPKKWPLGILHDGEKSETESEIEINHSPALEKHAHFLDEINHSPALEKHAHFLDEINHSPALEKHAHFLDEINHSPALEKHAHFLDEINHSPALEKRHTHFLHQLGKQQSSSALKDISFKSVFQLGSRLSSPSLTTHSPVLDKKTCLTTHSPVLDKKTCLTTHGPLLDKKTCLTSHSPVPDKKTCLTSHSPVLDKKTCLTSHSPVPDKKTCLTTHSPVPDKKTCLTSHSPVPDKKTCLTSHSPVPDKKTCLTSHSPVPDKKTCLTTHSPVPDKKTCLTSHSPVPDKKTCLTSHSPVPDKKTCLTSHSPVPDKKTCLTSHSPVPDKKTCLTSHSPVPDKKTCLTSHSPVPDKKTCLTSHSPVLDKKTCLTSHSPVPDKKTCLTTHSPVPDKKTCLTTHSPVLDKKTCLTSHRLVPDKKTCLKTDSPWMRGPTTASLTYTSATSVEQINKLLEHLQQEVSDLKADVANKSAFSDLQVQHDKLKSNIENFRNNHSAKIQHLACEVEKEKKLQLTTKVEIEQVKKFLAQTQI